MLRILIIGLQYPEPQSTAAGSRMLQIIDLLHSFDFDIHFACANPKTAYSSDLEGKFINTYSIHINDKSFESLLQKLQPEIVMFDRFITEEQFGWRVDEQCPKALKILDTEDLHFLRESREQAVKNPDGHKNQSFLTDKAKRELAAIYRCDWSLMISKAEIELLTKTYNIPKQLLFYLPFIYQTDKLQTQDFLDYDSRKHFLSIGNFKHKPNMDMVQYLYQDIWPKIRQKLPQAEWHIYGAYCPESIYQLHNLQKGVIVKGRAEEVLSTLEQYKVMLAPLRFGAGLKGKCLDSMQAGTPSVTTGIGAEGIASAENWPGFVVDEPDDFAEKAIELYTDKSLWEGMQNEGFQILKHNFDVKLFADSLKNKILKSLKHLDNFRQKNLIGELLKHHHHRSTKFMSLWIEEKNKLKS